MLLYMPFVLIAFYSTSRLIVNRHFRKIKEERARRRGDNVDMLIAEEPGEGGSDSGVEQYELQGDRLQVNERQRSVTYN